MGLSQEPPLLPPQPSPKLPPQPEADRPAVAALRPGAALSGKFLSTSSIPGCLLGVALEGDPPASLLQHVLLLEQARQQSTLIAGERSPKAPPLQCPFFPPYSRASVSPISHVSVPL